MSAPLDPKAKDAFGKDRQAEQRGQEGPEGQDGVDYHHRTMVNLVVAIVLLVIAIIATLIFNHIESQRKIQRCLDSGRRDCFVVPTAPSAQSGQRR